MLGKIRCGRNFRKREWVSRDPKLYQFMSSQMWLLVNKEPLTHHVFDVTQVDSSHSLAAWEELSFPVLWVLGVGVGACLGRGGVCAPLSSLGYITALIRLYFGATATAWSSHPSTPRCNAGCPPPSPWPLGEPCYSWSSVLVAAFLLGGVFSLPPCSLPSSCILNTCCLCYIELRLPPLHF